MANIDEQYDMIVRSLDRRTGLSDEDRGKIESWILDHSGERRLNESMARVWSSHDPMTSNASPIGLVGFLQAIEERSVGEKPLGKGRGIRPAIWRGLAIASMVALVLMAGIYFIGGRPGLPEHVLLTADGSIGEFTLPDGSHVWLNGGSRLSYTGDLADGRMRKVSIDGEAYFSVAQDKSHPFIIDMQDMEVRVTGTEFVVRNYAACNTHDIVLRSGSVTVSGPWSDKPVKMYHDEQLAFNRTTGKMAVSHTDANNYCRWFEQFPSFDDVPLSTILINISRRHGLDLEIDTDVDTDFQLSVTMGGETLESILTVVTSLAPVECTIQGNTLHVTAQEI